eukprot:scaffold2858_cov659-Pavlova_lutheri.AAC.109
MTTYVLARNATFGSDSMRPEWSRNDHSDAMEKTRRTRMVVLAVLWVLDRRGVWASVDFTCTFLFDEIHEHAFFYLKLLQLIGDDPPRSLQRVRLGFQGTQHLLRTGRGSLPFRLCRRGKQSGRVLLHSIPFHLRPEDLCQRLAFAKRAHARRLDASSDPTTSCSTPTFPFRILHDPQRIALHDRRRGTLHRELRGGSMARRGVVAERSTRSMVPGEVQNGF